MPSKKAAPKRAPAKKAAVKKTTASRPRATKKAAATTASTTTAAPQKVADSKRARLKITQVRSGVGRPETHRRTLRALGLRWHQASVVQPDNPAIRGMLFQVRHLVDVQELEGESK